MSIPMLAYGPTSQNQRVVSYEVPSEEHSRLYSSDDLPSGQEMDALIWAAYRQIFNEQQITASNRQLALESQLRSGQITVRDFIRGLALSDTFRRWIYDCNSNYRVVQLCVQRLLGRQVYSQRETIAWSIVLATQGLPQFIDALLASEEYLRAFGSNTVPYQRRRILPQQTIGELPFARAARYGAEHRDQLMQLGHQLGRDRWNRPNWQKTVPASPLLYVGSGLAAFGVIYLAAISILTVG